MSSPLPPNPATAAPLLEHLTTWGEVASCELRSLSHVALWIPMLLDAGVLCEIAGSDGHIHSWALTTAAQELLEIDGTLATRRALFQVPVYRRYLVGILAEGLVGAAKTAMWENLERWTGDELVPLLEEVNGVLDGVERDGHRLVDDSTEVIRQRSASFPGRDYDFSAWNQFLLGRAGRAEDLFDFALRRFALAAMLTSQPTRARSAVLHTLPLNTDDGFVPTAATFPAAWNTRRATVASGLALFDEQGARLFDTDDLRADAITPAVQDALLEQPFYKAVVHLAISAWRSPASTIPEVELYVSPGAATHEVTVLLDGRDAGRLAALLPALVGLQGFVPRGLDKGVVPDMLMANLIQNLLTQQMLVHADDALQLHPDFQASLMARRLRTVFRPGKVLQQDMLALLQERQPHLHDLTEASP